MLDGMTGIQQMDMIATAQIHQATLKSTTSFEGVGVHSGDIVHVTLKPADVNTGIVFKRTDIEMDVDDSRDFMVPARYDLVRDTRLCTKLINNDGVAVSTVEHLMAAFSALGIDNVIVEMNGEEMPIMDGSSEPFVFLIECAGIQEQKSPRRAIRVLKEVVVQGDKGEIVKLSPTDTLHMSIFASIAFDNTVIGCQEMYMNISKESFKSELSKARTFGFMRDIEMLRDAGLARGGSTDTAVIIDEDRVLNPSGLRFDDECVRHKTLDAVGDLYMAGAPILAHYHGERLGHAMNNQILHALFSDDSAYEWVEMDMELDKSLSAMKQSA